MGGEKKEDKKYKQNAINSITSQHHFFRDVRFAAGGKKSGKLGIFCSTSFVCKKMLQDKVDEEKVLLGCLIEFRINLIREQCCERSIICVKELKAKFKRN